MCENIYQKKMLEVKSFVVQLAPFSVFNWNIQVQIFYSPTFFSFHILVNTLYDNKCTTKNLYDQKKKKGLLPRAMCFLSELRIS